IVLGGRQINEKKVDFSSSHLVFPILDINPPFSTLRSAQVPLITSVNSFRLRWLKTAAHGIEHLLWGRVHALGRDGIIAVQGNGNAEKRNGKPPNSLHQ